MASVKISRASATPPNVSGPVWPISSTAPQAEASITALCDKHGEYETVRSCLTQPALDRPNQVCCRELKGEDERTLLNADIVRDAIIGFSDGITVPFGLTAVRARLNLVGLKVEFCEGLGLAGRFQDCGAGRFG